MIRNNIFFDSNPDCSYNVCRDNYYQNNIFASSPSFNNSSGHNNIGNINPNALFTSFSGNSYSPTDNYHLQPNSIGINAGTDGTDIGIYGGPFPWKEGAVPSNPHVQFININGNTNPNGTLPVNINVNAQDN